MIKEIVCLNCGKTKKCKMAPSTIKKGAGKYCSTKCRYEWQKKTSGSTRKCIICNKTFYAKGNPVGRKICSKECVYQSKKEGKVIKCENCGKEAYKPKCQLNKSHYFCSIKCANEFQGRNKVVRICPQCGKKFRKSLSVPARCCSEKCRLNDKEHINKVSTIGNLSQYKKRGLNKLETAGGDLLREMKLSFNEQINISDKFVVDVMLCDYKVVIQWDGIYWHSKPQRKKLDKSQDAYLTKCGYKVLRFTDRQVYKDKQYIYDTIRTTIQ